MVAQEDAASFFCPRSFDRAVMVAWPSHARVGSADHPFKISASGSR